MHKRPGSAIYAGLGRFVFAVAPAPFLLGLCSTAQAQSNAPISLVGAISIGFDRSIGIGDKRKGLACLPYGKLHLADIGKGEGAPWAELANRLLVASKAIDPATLDAPISATIITLNFNGCASTGALDGRARQYKGKGQITIQWAVPFGAVAGGPQTFITVAAFESTRRDALSLEGNLGPAILASVSALETKLMVAP